MWQWNSSSDNLILSKHSAVICLYIVSWSIVEILSCSLPPLRRGWDPPLQRRVPHSSDQPLVAEIYIYIFFSFSSEVEIYKRKKKVRKHKTQNRFRKHGLVQEKKNAHKRKRTRPRKRSRKKYQSIFLSTTYSSFCQLSIWTNWIYLKNEAKCLIRPRKN